MMELLGLVNDALIALSDYFFGWMLYLHRDVVLILVPLMTLAFLSYTRKWTTDQDWLKRADEDQKRLKALMKQAKREGDKDAVTRHKETTVAIQVKAIKFEGKPLLWAILPVGLLATWALGRLAFVPLAVGETAHVKMYFPKAAIGQTVYMVPNSGVDVTNGLMQTVVQDTLPPDLNAWDVANSYVCSNLDKAVVSGLRLCGIPAASMRVQPEGVAVWHVKAKDDHENTLQFRYAGRTYEKKFFAGGKHYPTSFDVIENAPVQGIEVAMKPMKLFDYVGAMDFLMLQPWLVAYLLIAIILFSPFRRICKIY